MTSEINCSSTPLLYILVADVALETMVGKMPRDTTLVTHIRHNGLKPINLTPTGASIIYQTFVNLNYQGQLAATAQNTKFILCVEE